MRSRCSRPRAPPATIEEWREAPRGPPMSVYVPEHFAARERATIARLVHDFPFATLVTPGATEPSVTHLPLLHVPDCEPHGTLVGHFARANPHAQSVSNVESMAL